jgi:hypothetical protein
MIAVTTAAAFQKVRRMPGLVVLEGRVKGLLECHFGHEGVSGCSHHVRHIVR